MKRIQKDYQTTPLTGLVEDSLQSNSTTNAPSINAVRNALTPPQNLLINGDFQINQRGLSEYVGDGNRMYTVDMWALFGGSKLTVQSDGVVFSKLSNNYGGFIQVLDNPLNSPKGYIVVCEIENLSDVAELVVNNNNTQDTVIKNQQLENGINVIVIPPNTDFNEIYFYTEKNISFKIKYIDLFKDDIAYKHVKEDYATALMRCQRYLEKGEYSFSHVGEYYLSGTMFRFPKDKTPVVTITSMADANNPYPLSKEAVSITEYGFKFVKYNGTTAETLPKYVYAISYIATCEPY